MTLNITIVSPWGIWQCSDLRVTDLSNGELLDDYSVKQIHVRATDGAALISYTGFGWVPPGRRSVSDWLRRTIRGASRTIDETLILIRERATSTFGRRAVDLGVRHTFMVGAFLAGRPWAIVITNLDPDNPLENPPLPRFNTSAIMVVGDKYEPMAFVTGAREAVSPDDMALLNTIAARKPKRPVDYQRVMAEINKRAAKQRPVGELLISERCVTSYVPPAGEPFESNKHWWGLTAPSDQRAVPLVMFGIDLTELEEVMINNFEALHDTNTAAREEARKRFGRLTEEAGKRSVRRYY